VPIGQVILGVQDLDVATRRFESLGFGVVDGGVHPGLGTANRVIPLGNAYLELLGAIDREEAARSDYGRFLLDRTADGDRLVRWSIRTTEIERVGERLGLTPEPRQRLRPDGSLLTWRSAGIDLSLRDAWLPFFMQWDDPAQYPGAIPAEHPNDATALAWLQVSPADHAQLARWTEAQSDLPLHVGDGAPGIDAVAVTTTSGDLVITS
jgi:hypothetical protein